MRYLIILLVFFISVETYAKYDYVETHFEPNKKWYKKSKIPDLSLRNLFRVLVKSKRGKALVQKANRKAKASGLSLYEVVLPGEGSLTDTTLVRKFNPSNLNKVTYETNSKVYINTSLNQYDALFDLAHELTHYVYRKGFNPYKLNFSLKEFIKSTIEGRGGEVQAFLMECRIQEELFPKQVSRRSNCMKITDPQTNKVSFSLAVNNFYRVGNYYESFVSMLDKHGIKHLFPKVSSRRENFISSAYGIPYPVAAFEEYLNVLNKVCENDKKRIGYFKQKGSRAPASVALVEKSYNARCKSFN